MISKLKALQDREDGFTLIELLIVVVIIGILAAIAIPIFLNQQKAAIAGTVKSDVRNTVSNVALQLTKNPTASSAELLSTVVVVQSSDNVVSIFGGYDSYSILGSNVNAFGGIVPTPAEVKTSTGTGKSGYLYDSKTGKYYGIGELRS